MRALLSVSDKTGIVDFAAGLAELGYELVSTGGTLAHLAAAGVAVGSVSDVTGFPEILDGRVKTLHPRIHGGLLARRDDPTHSAQLARHGIVPIDVVAINLYPFEATVARPAVTLEEAIEQIDIGGPALLRAAAKNFASVVVVSDPTDYSDVLAWLRSGSTSQDRRRALAAKAFGHVAAYDSLVAEYLRTAGGDEASFPKELTLAGRMAQVLRYGENPHQQAAAYRSLTVRPAASGVLQGRQLAGKELSFNNLLDADAAWNAIGRFAEPAVAVVKHTIPCGLAERSDVGAAFTAALAGDPVSAFGGIVAANRVLDLDTASRMAEVFFEVILAPGFTPDALDVLRRRKQLRLLEMPSPSSDRRPASWAIRSVTGGLLVQEADDRLDDSSSWRVVTQRGPSEEEWIDLRFAWEAVRHVKSNGIVLAKDRAVVGVGSGQPNRVESVRIAARKAAERGLRSVLASDAFFPFPDGVEAAARAGARAIVQPGGSVRDGEIIAAADAAAMAMVFTGVRHFLH